MLPFTIETYFALIAQYNQAIWPFPLAGFPLAMIAIAGAMGPFPRGARAVGAVLVLAWLLSGIGFHLLHFATINFSAPAYAVLFVIQALLIGWIVLARGHIRFRFVPDVYGIAGVTLAGLGVSTWPVVGLILGSGDFTAAPFFAADPTATILFTLALLLLAEGREVVWLAVIPVLWTFVDGATFLALGTLPGLVFPLIGLVVFVLLVLKRMAQGKAQGNAPNGTVRGRTNV